jgi:hypothetical protein
MHVVRARIQTVEEIYRLVWTAVANKQPMEAIYQGRHRLFCPHRLGRNKEGQLRVLCYQYGGKSQARTSNVSFVHELALCRARKTQQGEGAGSVGIQPRIIRVPGPAWLKPILTGRINPSAIHKKDIETVAQAVAGQASFAAS